MMVMIMESYIVTQDHILWSFNGYISLIYAIHQQSGKNTDKVIH